jgi:beta-mannosidase
MPPDRAEDTGPGVNASPSSGSKSIELTAWQVARCDAGSAQNPESLTIPDQEWIDATVPGTVAGALDAAGLWSWKNPPPIDEYDWWYRCKFSAPAAATGAALNFQGLATIADVWLNGVHILLSDNMFVAHDVEVGSVLRDQNLLLIRFKSLTAELAARRLRPRWRTRLINNQNLRWIRTTFIGRMPGWSSAAQPVGPWKSVTLIPHAVARVISKKVRTSLAGTTGVITIEARVQGRDAEIDRASVLVDGREQEAKISSFDGGHVVSATVHVEDAKIWWPHTHGGQPLYDLAIRLVAGMEVQTVSLGRVAFRNFALDNSDDDFLLRINGERVFWRGVCWSPQDQLRMHCSAGEYRRSLTLARDAGMNMIRVGGTMVYEHDAFYDLCDELGIAVWQDFMLANMDYPASDPTFVANVEREAIELLQRIGDRPSIALFCGNSEVEQQASMLGLPQDQWRSTLFSETLPKLVAEHAPDAIYWPSSPSGGVLPFHVNGGDGHYFGYGPYLRPFSDVRASDVRFASETLAFANVPEPLFVDSMTCGVAGAGHHPEWKSGVPRDNGSGWDFEDVRDHYVKEIFGVDPVAARYSDPERYLALGRAAAGEVMTRAIAEWRRAGSTCNGALVWLYRDLRPGAGWGVLDYNGAPKAAYHYLARTFRPVTVVMSDEGLNGIMIHAVNDTADEIAAEVRLVLFRGAVRVGECTAPVTLRPHSTDAMSADAMLGSFTDISYAYRFGAPNHDTVVATLVDREDGRYLADAFQFPTGLSAPRPETRISTRVERIDDRSYTLILNADELAVAVEIEISGWSVSDNYFHLQAGGERTVLLTANGVQARLAGRVSALNAKVPVGFHA